MSKRRIKNKWHPWIKNPRGIYRKLKMLDKELEREWSYFNKYNMIIGHLKLLDENIDFLKDLKDKKFIDKF